jgi:hypothetical protein
VRVRGWGQRSAAPRDNRPDPVGADQDPSPERIRAAIVAPVDCWFLAPADGIDEKSLDDAGAGRCGGLQERMVEAIAGH